MRPFIASLLLLAAAMSAASAQTKPVSAVVTAPVSDSAFYPNLIARFQTHRDPSAGWQFGFTSFITARNPFQCPVVGGMRSDDILYTVSALDSLQVDYRQVSPSAAMDSVFASTDREWHALDLAAIKAKYKSCR